ncbi:hypothetical protein EOF34_21005, partial [Salmonella enterica]|nr:hypothetical protein [Salmonella enterica]ECS8458277.1 hypothetical protein [Salmonella enterica subsp. enterica serovar Javiana]EBM6912917.1 hypothetical protein [Salmonella enterica]ECR9202910.1 hypothetical protein [Salmonella enterica]EEK2943778.1 hypothetical protein [Salmonella enterica]
QMAILVISDSENDLDYPNKRKWFDASRWLSTSQYIKIDDFYLLNLKYHPVDNVNDAGIIVILHFAIRDAIKKFPELLKLSQMDNKDFFHFMQNKLSNEYLRTKFNEDTLEPTDDYFLFFFTYNEISYEVELLRKVTDHGIIFVPYGYQINKKGDWHRRHPSTYSYFNDSHSN